MSQGRRLRVAALDPASLRPYSRLMNAADFANKTFAELDAREQAAVRYGWEPEHAAICGEIVARRDARRALGDTFENFEPVGTGVVPTAAKLIERGLDGRCYVRRETRKAQRHRMFRDGQTVEGFAFYSARTGAEAGFIAPVRLKTPSAYTGADVSFFLGEADLSQSTAPKRFHAVWRKLAI